MIRSLPALLLISSTLAVKSHRLDDVSDEIEVAFTRSERPCPENPWRIYELDRRILARGAHGIIHLAKKRSTGEILVLKRPTKRSYNEVMIEITNQQLMQKRWQLQDDSAILLSDCEYLPMDDNGHSDASVGTPWIAYQYFPAGDLFSYVKDRGLGFDEIRSIGRDILDALVIIHAKGFVAHDIKPENIVLYEKDGRTRAKLIDLGLMTPKKLQVPWGTTSYAAPETLRQRIDMEHEGVRIHSAADMWSFGLTLVIMRTGKDVYDRSLSDRKVLHEILSSTRGSADPTRSFMKPRYAPGYIICRWMDADYDDCAAFRKLTRDLLRFHPNERLSAEEALAHPFFSTV